MMHGETEAEGAGRRPLVPLHNPPSQGTGQYLLNQAASAGRRLDRCLAQVQDLHLDCGSPMSSACSNAVPREAVLEAENRELRSRLAELERGRVAEVQLHTRVAELERQVAQSRMAELERQVVPVARVAQVFPRHMPQQEQQPAVQPVVQVPVQQHQPGVQPAVEPVVAQQLPTVEEMIVQLANAHPNPIEYDTYMPVALEMFPPGRNASKEMQAAVKFYFFFCVAKGRADSLDAVKGKGQGNTCCEGAVAAVRNLNINSLTPYVSWCRKALDIVAKALGVLGTPAEQQEAREMLSVE